MPDYKLITSEIVDVLAKHGLFSASTGDLLKQFITESDRGCVLTFFSAIDDKLEAILRAYLETDREDASEIALHELQKERQKVRDSLLRPGVMSPLGSAATRTDLVFALGLIDGDTKKSLDGVRRLRRDSAHGQAAIEFTEETVAPILLHLGDQNQDLAKKVREFAASTGEALVSQWRAAFLLAGMCIYAELDSAHKRAATVSDLKSRIQGKLMQSSKPNRDSTPKSDGQ